MKKVVLFFTALLCWFFNLHGQTNNIEFYKFSSAIYNDIKKDSALWRGGITSTDLSFIGLYKEALIEMDKANPYRKIISPTDSLDFIKTYKPTNAAAFILKKAEQQQILIFNEAHYNPRNRVFVTSLLPGLKKLGFTYLAAETLTNPYYGDLKHPGITSGYYSSEPQFGNMLRQAVALGYTLYPYEDTTGANGRLREIGEARNLQTLLKRDPQAKIIIYCGFSHILEDRYQAWEKAMAGRLKEYTGIDPYTIDQVELTERLDADLANPYYKLVYARSYSVFLNKNKEPFHKRLDGQHVDALLYTPPTSYRYNRPGWVFENGKAPYFLKAQAVTITYPILVKAYLQSDNPETAVPVDVIEIRNSEDLSKTAVALFSKGTFTLQLQSQNGGHQTITVQR